MLLLTQKLVLGLQEKYSKNYTTYNMEENKIIIYQTEDGQTQIDVRLENETVWLTQAQMAELIEKDRTVVGRHISNVFKEGELVREEVSAKIAHTTRHGAIKGKLQTQETTLYNLDVIISVGYHVHSKRGTAFRICEEVQNRNKCY